MSKRPRTKKKHRSELMEAISDVVRTVCVLQSWRYLVPALELLDLLERSTAADSPGIEEDAVDSKLRDDAVVSARNLKHEQFIEVPVFDRMAPLVRYLAGLYHRYQERRAVLPLRIVDVAITTLVESYSEHEGQIVREYQRICKKEAPKGRPAKRLSAVRIEKLLSEGLSLEKIGERLRVHRNTIYRQAETSPVLRSALDRGRIKYRRSPLAVEPSGYQN
jgi:hypothetical protein